MFGFLAKLIPQSSEQVIDEEITVESKVAIGALFGAGFTYLMKVPMAATIAQMLGINLATASGWGIVAAAAVSAWLCAFLHKHVYNGNASPVVLKQAAGAVVATAPADPPPPPIVSVGISESLPASNPVPNAPAPAAQAVQPPAGASPITPPSSSEKSPG